MRRFTLIFPLLLYPVLSFGILADVKVCFTPGEPCDTQIVRAIGEAKEQILVQAYQLTSPSIVGALANAHDRGVAVALIVDKSQVGEKGWAVRYLVSHKIRVYVDNKVAIAHNKVIIIDEKEVITGSYNFSKAAQTRNAENVVMIDSREVASKFISNFIRRISVSDNYITP